MKYTKAGTYEIVYKAIDECGNETSETRTVIVNEVENLFAWGLNKGVPNYDQMLVLDVAYEGKLITSDTIDLRFAVEGVRCVVSGTTYTPTWEDAEFTAVFDDNSDSYYGAANWQIPNSTSKVGLVVVMTGEQHIAAANLELVDDDGHTEVYFDDIKVYIKGE